MPSPIVGNSAYLIAQTGPSKLADGAQNTARLAGRGELVVNDVGLGRYYESAVRNSVFEASLQAGTALSVISATATGIIITNPPNSGVNVSLIRIVVGLTVVAAGITSLVLCGNAGPNAAVTHTTPMTPQAMPLGNATRPVALVDSAATIPATPTIFYVLNASSASPAAGQVLVDHEFAGEFVLGPGTVVSLQSLTTAETVMGTIVWAEAPAGNSN